MMTNNYTNYLLILFVLLVLAPVDAFAQQYTDGPVQVQARVRDFRVKYNTSGASDLNLNIGNFGLSNFEDDELTFKVWVRDAANLDGQNWVGGTCYEEQLPMLNGGPEFTQDYNDVIFNYTYTGANVPQLLDLRLDAWEDDIPTDFDIISGLTPCGSSGSRCSFEASVTCINIIIISFSEGDDYRCNADPFFSGLDYRYSVANNVNIPPCRWYDQGYIQGSCPSNNFYQPKMETFWRYTKGTACTQADAITLGALTSGPALTHYNSNECYNNNFANGGGNDVFYTFNVASPIGASISLAAGCPSAATFNTRIYLLNSSCTVIDSASGTCGNAATINKALCDVGNYYVVVDGFAPTDDGAFTLTVAEDPSFTFSATISQTNVSCNGGSDGTAKVNINGGVSPYTYSWTGGQPAVDSIFGLSAGNYTVTASDAEGCTTTATVTITEPAVLTVATSTQSASCGGTNDGSATATPSGGTGPYNYAWSSVPQQTSATAVLLAAGTYTVVVTDANGCTATATATVTQSTNIVLTTNAVNNVSCNGADDGSIDIGVSGGTTPYSYSWSGGLPATQDQNGLAPGNYDVTVSDGVGCTVGASFVITEPSALVTSIGFTKDASCPNSEDGAADLEVVGGVTPYSYSWSNGDVIEELFDVAEGTYTVTVTDANGCTATESVTIAGPANGLSTTITKTDADCSQSIAGSAEVAVTGGTSPYTYFWSNFSTNATASGLNAGTYSVVVTDAAGCSLIDTVTIAELAPNGGCSGNDTINDIVPWFIPNIFTPNGDGRNDIFEIFVRDDARVTMTIFNRFGAKVYYNGDLQPNTGWDGTQSGDDVTEGTYVYLIDIDFVDDQFEDELLSGSITLIR